MTVQEFIASIEQPYATREGMLSNLHNHFQAKDFTAADILEFYRQRDTPKFIEAVKLFEQGKLFASQMQSYDSWAQGDFAKEDKLRAEKYWSLEDAAQMKKAEGTPQSIRTFIINRIFGSRPRADDMNDKVKNRWIAENKNWNWYWNR